MDTSRGEVIWTRGSQPCARLLSTSKALTASVSLSPLGSKLVRTQVRAQHDKSPPPSTTNLTRGG